MFDEYWKRLVEKNPHLANPDAKMTLQVKEFEKAMRRAYDAGAKSSTDKRSAAKAFENIGAKPKIDFGGVFGHLFGG